MNPLQWKEFFRCVLKTKSRFISMLLITALGVAFYVGIRASGPDMELSADSFYDQTNLMDIRVLGTLGMTEDDVAAIRSVEGVSAAQGAYSADVICPLGSTEYVASVFSLCDEINQMTVEEGRLPETADECFLDSRFMTNAGLQLGDTITLASGSDDPLTDTLVQDTYTIVGAGSWSWYLSWDRGTTSLGNGNIDFFLGLTPDAFSMEAYTVVYATVDTADELNSYSDDYTDAISEVTDRIEAIAGERCEIRYDDVTGDAQTELADAQQEIDDAQQEIDDAWAKLEDARIKLEDAEKELTDGDQELADKQLKLADAEKEIADSERELGEGRKALIEGQAELNAQITVFNQSKNELESGQQELDEQRTALEQKQTEVLAQKDELLLQQQTLAAQKPELEKQKTELEAKKSELLPQQQALEKQKQELTASLSELQTQRDSLLSQKESINQAISLYEQRDSLTAQRSELTDQLKEVESGLSALKIARSVYDSQMPALSEQEERLLAEQEELKARQESDLSAAEQAALDAALALNSANLAALNEVLTPLKEASALLDAKEAELTDYHEALTSGIAEIDAGLAQINAAIDSVGMSYDELIAARTALDEGIAQIDANLPALESGLAQVNDGLTQLNSGISQIDAGLAEVNSYLTQISDGEKQIADALPQIDSGLLQIQEGMTQINEAQAQLDSGHAQLEAGEKEIANARQTLHDKQQELAEGEKALSNARRQLADGKSQLSDGEIELEDGRAELEEGRIEYEDGLKEYNEAVAEAEPELEDARRQLADAREQLSEIDMPEWYVLDRNSIQTFVEYGMDADRISAIGEVFPVIFFLVAALVCLTGMTRMVEEERIQIGTFKALGYGKGMIAAKYFLYAFIASIVGSIIGILVGSSVLPYVIMNAYGMLYATLTTLLSPINWPLSISATCIAVFCVVFAAMAACLKTLRETPASLMRPTSPPKGKRVFLEYIRPLWRRMSFGQKAAARNLFRYKKRLFMTVFGIAGCMALLIVGYGLKDSIQKIVDTQYTSVWTYDASLTADAESLETVRGRIMREEPAVIDSLAVRQSAMDAESNGRTVEAYLFVPETTVGLDTFVRLQDRVSRETYALDDTGVVITEKMASLLSLSAGDTITLCRSETERFEARVLAVSENYLYHYIYMTPACYQTIFGEEPEFSQLFFHTEKMSEEDELSFSERVLSIDGVKSVSLVSSLQESVADMMNAMNLVIWVLIIAAGLLAFIVLFNLNNISILERRRELATLRVLGFYDGELAAYLYRENVVLTLLGIIAGVLLGVPLHSYIIGTLELDMIMFGRVIQPMSYVMSVLMTIFFAGVVNFGMFFTLRRIDMVESLKSVE